MRQMFLKRITSISTVIYVYSIPITLELNISSSILRGQILYLVWRKAYYCVIAPTKTNQ